MRLSLFTKPRWVPVVAWVAFYCLGYGWARSERILVHGVSFETHNGSKRYLHCVRMGDLGPGIMWLSGAAANRQLMLVASCSWVFTPLRWLESLAWHLSPRRYTVWSDEADSVPPRTARSQSALQYARRADAISHR